MFRRGIAVAIVASLALGCSSEPGNGDARVRTNHAADWLPTDIARAQTLVKQIKTGTGNQCSGAKVFPRGVFLVTFEKLNWPYPLAAGTCAFNDEDLQFELYESTQAVDRRLATREGRLCQQDGYDGFDYVKVGEILLLPDSKQTADTLAGVVHGTTGRVNCDH